MTHLNPCALALFALLELLVYLLCSYPQISVQQRQSSQDFLTFIQSK